jgi:hypothetical protein
MFTASSFRDDVDYHRHIFICMRMYVCMYMYLYMFAESPMNFTPGFGFDPLKLYAKHDAKMKGRC